jgi:hypothetical protein
VETCCFRDVTQDSSLEDHAIFQTLTDEPWKIDSEVETDWGERCARVVSGRKLFLIENLEIRNDVFEPWR